MRKPLRRLGFLMSRKKFLLADIIVYDEQSGSQPPGDGIAQKNRPYSRPVGHCQEDPEDAQDAYAGAGHNGRHYNIAHSS